MSFVRVLILGTSLALLAACTAPQPGETVDGIFDPYEADNRKAHAVNLKLDEKLLRPAGKGYANVVPDGAQVAVANFADTLSLPQTVVNQTLQGKLDRAGRNILRFVLNAVVGLGGFFDAASELGIGPEHSDFGETLAVWGVREGAYTELPILGPGTERDQAGRFVDFFTNPLSYVIPTPERHIITGSKIADGVGRRGQLSDTVDALLYESADSYAQVRSVYLQNRRYTLGEDDPGADLDLGLDTEGF
jgi:phospholipid-binding lipoprotein MlaA